MKRAAELAVAIATHQARGGTVLLLTLTTQHSFGELLDEVWSAVQESWAYMTGHYRYRKLRDRLGIGFVRAVEVMHGYNGWHPHLHVLLFVDTPVDPFDNRDDYVEIARTFHDLWVKRMAERHCRDVRSSYGVDLQVVKGDGAEGVGMYCTKAGFEVALADGKVGRTSTSRHPFAIAYDAVETGDMADINLFREWVKGSHGRRMWSWSKGLRDRLGLGRRQDRRGAGVRGRGVDRADLHDVAEVVASDRPHPLSGCVPCSCRCSTRAVTAWAKPSVCWPSMASRWWSKRDLRASRPI